MESPILHQTQNHSEGSVESPIIQQAQNQSAGSVESPAQCQIQNLSESSVESPVSRPDQGGAGAGLLPPVPQAQLEAAEARRDAGTPNGGDEVLLSHAISDRAARARSHEQREHERDPHERQSVHCSPLSARGHLAQLDNHLTPQRPRGSRWISQGRPPPPQAPAWK